MWLRKKKVGEDVEPVRRETNPLLVSTCIFLEKLLKDNGICDSIKRIPDEGSSQIVHIRFWAKNNSFSFRLRLYNEDEGVCEIVVVDEEHYMMSFKATTPFADGLAEQIFKRISLYVDYLKDDWLKTHGMAFLEKALRKLGSEVMGRYGYSYSLLRTGDNTYWFKFENELYTLLVGRCEIIKSNQTLQLNVQFECTRVDDRLYTDSTNYLANCEIDFSSVLCQKIREPLFEKIKVMRWLKEGVVSE